MSSRFLTAMLMLLTPLLDTMAQTDGDSPPPVERVEPQILGEPLPPPPLPPPPETVPLSEWLEAMKTQMPAHICQDRGEWLRCFAMAPDSCEQQAEEIATLCLDILAQNMPSELTEVQAGRWGVEAARCFNLTFLNLHQDKLLEDENCREPPAHLR